MTQEEREDAEARRMDRLATIAAGVAAAVVERGDGADAAISGRLAFQIANMARAIYEQLE